MQTITFEDFFGKKADIGTIARREYGTRDVFVCLFVCFYRKTILHCVCMVIEREKMKT